MNKNIKKVLSLVVAMIMLIATFVVPSTAVIAGSKATYSLSLSKCDDLPMIDNDGETAITSGNVTDGDIYKLVISVNTTVALKTLNMAVTYDTNIFQPLYGSTIACGMDVSKSSLDDGAWCVFNVTTKDMGEKTTAGRPAGVLADANAYNGSWVATTNKLQQKNYGPFNSSAATEYSINDLTTGAVDWKVAMGNAGYAETDTHIGCVLASASYNNAPSKPIKLVIGETECFEVFFKLQNGANPEGAEFRFGLTDATAVDTTEAGYAGGMKLDTVESISGTKYKHTAPAAPSPVYAKGSQIRFNGKEVDGAKANFDVRTRAALKAEDFATICGSEDNAKALADAGKLQVGFVYTAGTMDVATAKAVATGTAADGYKNVPVTYIQSTGTEYVWTCLITNADYNASVQALAYIIVDGTAYYFDAASTTTFSELYVAWYDDYVASLS